MPSKTEKRLSALGARPMYYYRGRVAVCILRVGDEIVARGIAVCSMLDQFSKPAGRAKALRRAVTAAWRGETTMPINPYLRVEAHPVHTAALLGQYKSEYSPELNEFEKTILERTLSYEHAQDNESSDGS